EEKKLAEWKSVGFLMVWSAFMQQGFPDTPRPAVLRLIFLLSYTVGVLLLASYAATLVSFLTVSSSSLPFDSLSAMAALKDYRLGIQIGSVCEELMLSPSYINLYERLVLPYSDTQDRNFSKLKLRALSDPYFSLLATYEIQRSTHDGSCLLVHSKFDVMYNNGAYAFTRGSHFVPLFNYFIAKVRESGVLQRSILEYYPTQACPDDHDMSVGHTQVFTAFLALGCCSILAVLVVFLECLIRR
ncbi:Ionotropic glutamate receptor, partial [Trinorchestia longiramus]